MSLGKTWFAPEDAASMFGIGKALILEWVGEGLVRCEREGGKILQVNIDDVRLQVEALTK
jgi:predicted site-specific integrase-resolvase